MIYKAINSINQFQRKTHRKIQHVPPASSWHRFQFLSADPWNCMNSDFKLNLNHLPNLYNSPLGALLLVLRQLLRVGGLFVLHSPQVPHKQHNNPHANMNMLGKTVDPATSSLTFSGPHQQNPSHYFRPSRHHSDPSKSYSNIQCWNRWWHFQA